MQLPESLHPWRQWLEWFAPQYLPLFSDLLGRLNPLLGPLRGLQQGGVPEPDGLGDLQRRGAYERLLSSEWLLAEEIPDEFLRRAVVGEHLFLAPQYRARQANRLIVMLFDAGPLQLGAARLVHLALLMLLARRAEEAGAELRWGILQSDPCLFELDSAAQLRQLLDARTWQVVGDEHWHAWRTWLGEQPQTAGECWLVGQRLPRADNSPCTHRVQLQRSLDGKHLAFELQAATTRRVTLPIPPEHLAVPLLKGQFMDDVSRPPVVRGSVPRVSLTLPPVISATGNYIALRLLDEPGMVVIRLPSGNRQTSLQVHTPYWSAGRTPLAVTFMNRTVAAVMSDDNHLTFWNMRGLAPVDKPGREELQLPPGTATWLPIAWLHGREGGRLFLLDTQGRLAFWIARNGKSRQASGDEKTHRLTDKVLGMAKVDAQLVAYARNEDGRLYAHSIDVDGNQMCAGMIGVAEGVSEVLFAASPAWRKSIGGCALGSVESGSQRWRLLAAEDLDREPEQILLAPGWKALGLLLLQGSRRYALVLLSPDKHSVGLWCEGQQNVLFTTTAPIARVSFCNLSSVVAAITSARELLVYSAHWRRMRLQVMCNQLTEKHPVADKEDADA